MERRLVKEKLLWRKMLLQALVFCKVDEIQKAVDGVEPGYL